MVVTLCYITVPGRAEAERIGRLLVEQRLAACVNILDGVRSIYRWEGALQEDDEAVLLVKTCADRVTELTSLVVREHPASCPCVLTIPVSGGHADYLTWVAYQTR
ncbi:MAG: divalent-cation tolerance protein CutA [Desulfovibrionaceae bacterium]